MRRHTVISNDFDYGPQSSAHNIGEEGEKRSKRRNRKVEEERGEERGDGGRERNIQYTLILIADCSLTR